MPPVLCLNMIVRNEAANIERCLAAVAPVIGAWVIGDTGSTDDTPERIARFFAARGIPGELHRFPFENFGQARNEALDRCRRSDLDFDYILFADADMELVVGDRSCLGKLAAAAYMVRQRNDISYENLRLLRRNAEARYIGATHEYLDVRGETDRLAGIWYLDHESGANRTGKYERDIRLLRENLVREPNNARSVFYLAQSYRDAGRDADAIAAYRRRAAMGGWEEEIWYSLYQIARLTQRLGHPPAGIVGAYMAAYQFRPQRAEPLLDLAVWYRQRGEWAMALLHARAARDTPRPDDSLFVLEQVYQWRADDETAIAAFWAGDPLTSFALSWSLLDADRVPEDERSRIEENTDFAAPVVARAAGRYPADVVERLVRRARAGEAGSGVTLTMHCCGRPDSFAITVNSLLNCCRDIDAIDRFVCLDTGWSEADRASIAERYPFFEFLFDGAAGRCRARAMNRLLGVVTTPLWLHIDGEWQFLVTTDYVVRALSVLACEPAVAQVLFNRNFAEALGDRRRVGGSLRRHPDSGLRYRVHEHLPQGAAREAFLGRLPTGAEPVIARPHFGLQPSLLRTESVRRIGPFDEASVTFAQDFSERYTAAGLQSAFFDAVTCTRIIVAKGEPGATGSAPA